MPRYDVAMIGAGPAGICAALSAARSGARTLLVTDRPVPGGNSSSEIRVWTRGATGGGNLFAEEMGIWGELKLRALARDALGSVLTWDDVLLDALLGQEGLTLLLNTQMTAATVENGRIERVTLRGLRTESEREAQAQVFVDCTGDGYLSKLARVPFRTGREGREEFGESLALSARERLNAAETRASRRSEAAVSVVSSGGAVTLSGRLSARLTRTLVRRTCVRPSSMWPATLSRQNT